MRVSARWPTYIRGGPDVLSIRVDTCATLTMDADEFFADQQVRRFADTRVLPTVPPYPRRDVVVARGFPNSVRGPRPVGSSPSPFVPATS